jgi:hypothetical protein
MIKYYKKLRGPLATRRLIIPDPLAFVPPNLQATDITGTVFKKATVRRSNPTN